MDARVQRLVASCHAGPAVSAGRLRVVPLVSDDDGGPSPEPVARLHPDEPLNLSEREGDARVEEVQAFNGTARDVIVLEGELLAGGFQDRMVSASCLLRRRTAGILATTCSEEGRFDGQDPQFQVSGRMASPRYRRRLRLGLHNQSQPDQPAPRQRMIWDDIDLDRQTLGEPEEGLSLLHLRQVTAGRCRDLAAPLRATVKACGWLVFVDHRFVAGDLFAGARLAAGYATPLLEAAAFDALLDSLRESSNGDSSDAMPSGQWEDLGAELDGALVVRQDMGTGTSRLCFDSPALTGTTLIHNGQPLHLSFFPAIYAEDVDSMS